MALRAAILLLAIATVTAQTTLPLKALTPTLVTIKVRGGAAILWPLTTINDDEMNDCENQ